MQPDIPDYPASVTYCRCGDHFTGFDCALCRAAYVSLHTMNDFLHPPGDYVIPEGEPF